VRVGVRASRSSSFDKEEVSRGKERLPSRFVFERAFRFEILPVLGFTLVKEARKSKIENALYIARNGRCDR